MHNFRKKFFPNKVSVIMVHWSMNDLRSAVMKESIRTLIETAPEAEIIVVDNGGSISDSVYLLNLTEEGKITCYVRNRKNLSFGVARNQAIAMATGEYIVVADNDIVFSPGWLEHCKNILKKAPNEKYLVTPLKTDRQHRNFKHWREAVIIDGKEYLTNTRAGSNCWMMTRKQWEDVGKFEQHQVAGSYWANECIRKGYLMITMEKDSLAKDMCFKQGYNYKASIENLEP